LEEQYFRCIQYGAFLTYKLSVRAKHGRVLVSWERSAHIYLLAASELPSLDSPDTLPTTPPVSIATNNPVVY